MSFTLPALPYKDDALEPFIDRRTMEIHHGRHHQAYVTSLNAALEGHPDLQSRSIEDLLRNIRSLPADVSPAVRNHGGGHANHSMFWQSMAAKAGGSPTGEMSSAIRSSFGGFEEFKEQFTRAAIGVFGSGWVWVIEERSRLAITTTANQDSPLMQGDRPVMGLDLWEHAYYLQYQNRRTEYVSAWWHVVNWPAIERRLVGDIVGAAVQPLAGRAEGTGSPRT